MYKRQGLEWGARKELYTEQDRIRDEPWEPRNTGSVGLDGSRSTGSGVGVGKEMRRLWLQRRGLS